MWQHLQIENFKGVKKIGLDLERLTVIVGPNGAGKTSILEALDLLHLAYDGELSAALKERPNVGSLISRHGAEHTALTGILNDERFGIRLASANAAFPFEPSNAATIKTDSGDFRLEISKSPRTKRVPVADDETVAVPMHQLIGRSLLTRFEVPALAAPSESAATVPTLTAEGRGLPTVLNHLSSVDRLRFDKTMRCIRDIVPNFRSVNTVPARIERPVTEFMEFEGKQFQHVRREPIAGHELRFDFHGARGLPASNVSDGTILLLGILTLALGKRRPRLLLLDDIDRGLHPKAQRQLIELIREVAGSRAMQVVATTHSPYLLDALRPEEIVVTNMNEREEVVAAKLSNHPEIGKWMEVMSPGEIWGMIGESWVNEGKSSEVDS